MAKITSHKYTVFFNLVSVLFFVLMATRVESRYFTGTFFCRRDVQVNSGDTCYAIAQQYGLTLDTFYSYNPNVNCDDLSIGQYFCVVGAWI
ncbi:hypothetical protein ACJRO7_034545 [Eucalyptus globulus]|uniref:LysM domain-containing protein n=1 Tax=Eucalyptus globulus TaxID=34317 RepID=A0ABD3J3Q7_EUCGL